MIVCGPGSDEREEVGTTGLRGITVPEALVSNG
jgi:hypothetical protein